MSETSPHFMKFAAVLHSLFHMLLVFFFWIMFIMYLYLLVLPYASNKSTNDLDDGKLILLLYFKFPFLNKWIYYIFFSLLKQGSTGSMTSLPGVFSFLCDYSFHLFDWIFFCTFVETWWYLKACPHTSFLSFLFNSKIFLWISLIA